MFWRRRKQRKAAAERRRREAILAEKTRLYQAAIEERRMVLDRADSLIASEAIEAIEHIEREVEQAKSEMDIAWMEVAWLGSI